MCSFFTVGLFFSLFLSMPANETSSTSRKTRKNRAEKRTISPDVLENALAISTASLVLSTTEEHAVRKYRRSRRLVSDLRRIQALISRKTTCRWHRSRRPFTAKFNPRVFWLAVRAKYPREFVDAVGNMKLISQTAAKGSDKVHGGCVG